MTINEVLAFAAVAEFGALPLECWPGYRKLTAAEHATRRDE